MRITVLGKSPAWADAGGACSGYLVEAGSTSVLLDCGPGVLGKLRALRDYASIDAVVISHLHADHMLDVVPFASALIYGPRWAIDGRHRPRPVLHAPPGAGDAFTVVCEGSGMFGNHVDEAFELREYDPAESLEIGPLRVRFRPVPHYVPAHAVEIAEGERRLTFSSDCGPNSGLCDFARDTDLLLIEAAVTEEAVAADAGERGHLTPREAGEHGRRAGARRVVLTHVSDELDAATVLAQGSAGYGAAVELAAERAAYDI